MTWARHVISSKEGFLDALSLGFIKEQRSMERLEGTLPFISHLLMDALKTQTLQANVGQGGMPLSSDMETFAE